MVEKDKLKKRVAERLKNLEDDHIDDFALMQILEKKATATLYLIFYDLSAKGITNIGREALIKKMTTYRQLFITWIDKLKPFKIFLIRQRKNNYHKYIIKPEEFFEEKFINKALDTVNKEETEDG